MKSIFSMIKANTADEENFIFRLIDSLEKIGRKRSEVKDGLPRRYELVRGRSIGGYDPKRNANYQYHPDVMLYVDNKLRSMFEVRSSLHWSIEGYFNQVRWAFERSGADYFVFVVAGEFYLWHRGKDAYEHLSSIEALAEILFPTLVPIPISEKAKSFVSKNIERFYFATCSYSNRKPDENVLKKMLDALVYSVDGKEIGFSENHRDLEMLIWENLMPNTKYDDKTFVRYTTIATLESILKYKSLRLMGIVGMNDPLEVREADIALNGKSPKTIPPTELELEEINNTYISSCMGSAKKDDLTAWRLYGDDSRGVCLVFEVDNVKIESNPNLWIRRVSYADNDGNHPGLNHIKEFITRLAKHQMTFNFYYWPVWKHFFKSQHWEIESEVRILYKKIDDRLSGGTRSWVTTFSDGIFNPCIDFSLNSDGFPIKLREIILGPNCPERDVNCRQIQQYVVEIQNARQDEKNQNSPRFLNDDKIQVYASKLGNIYRKR